MPLLPHVLLSCRILFLCLQTAFICLFCADVLFWCFFSCETALRARAMGLKRFSQDRQCLFDTFLQLVGLSAIFLRVCILTNVCGLGMRIFDPDSLEWKIGIANEFIVGDVQIALVVSTADLCYHCSGICPANLAMLCVAQKICTPLNKIACRLCYTSRATLFVTKVGGPFETSGDRILALLLLDGC